MSIRRCSPSRARRPGTRWAASLTPSQPAFEHEQFGAAKLPIGPLRLPTYSTPTDAVGIGNAAQRPRLPQGDPAPTIDLNTGHVAPYDGWVPEEPTAAAVGDTVVYTSNDMLSLSVDGGQTFHSFDPRSMYKDSPAGGPDGDQDVIYVPQIKKFVWIVQYFPGKNGANLDRLAVFSPSAVTATGLTSWTSWDISHANLPDTHIFFDFPDLAFGNKYLYLTQNSGKGSPASETSSRASGSTTCSTGSTWPPPRTLGATPLADCSSVRSCRTPAASPTGPRTAPRAPWLPRTGRSHRRVWFWSRRMSTSRVGRTSTTSTTPDGQSWLNLYTGVVLASARVGNDLYFAWTAGRGSGRLAWLAQPHVELVEMTTSFTFVSQRAIWNPNYVYAWPYLTSAPNQKGVSELGISLVWGGANTYYPNAAVGDLTTSPNFVDTVSRATPKWLRPLG